MDANPWLWFALVAFLIFCCLPMVFMGRHAGHPDARDPREDSDKSSGGGGPTP